MHAEQKFRSGMRGLRVLPPVYSGVAAIAVAIRQPWRKKFRQLWFEPSDLRAKVQRSACLPVHVLTVKTKNGPKISMNFALK